MNVSESLAHPPVLPIFKYGQDFVVMLYRDAGAKNRFQLCSSNVSMPEQTKIKIIKQ
jgi:hypothetical protein